MRVASPFGTRRVSALAFDYARQRGRRRITVGHKASEGNFTDNIWLATVREVAQEYPDVELESMAIDNLCLGLVRRPGDFDILLLIGHHCDILSDLCAGLVGGLGLAPGANFGRA